MILAATHAPDTDPMSTRLEISGGNLPSQPCTQQCSKQNKIFGDLAQDCTCPIFPAFQNNAEPKGHFCDLCLETYIWRQDLTGGNGSCRAAPMPQDRAARGNTRLLRCFSKLRRASASAGVVTDRHAAFCGTPSCCFLVAANALATSTASCALRSLSTFSSMCFYTVVQKTDSSWSRYEGSDHPHAQSHQMDISLDQSSTARPRTADCLHA